MKATRRLAILCCLLVLAACTTAAEVTSSKSMALPAPFDRSTPLPVVDALPAIDAVVWGDCDEQEAPWQCASIEVPLDYRRVTELGTVSIAITRRPSSAAMNTPRTGFVEVSARLFRAFANSGFVPRNTGT